MNCEYCGSLITSGAASCNKCGAPILSDPEDAEEFVIVNEEHDYFVAKPLRASSGGEPEGLMPEYVVWALGQGLFVCLMYAIYLFVTWIFGG